MKARLGICQWFHYEAYQEVERTISHMHDLGVKMLRTGISWADYHRPNGNRWYDWQMRALSEFDVLLSIWHTPPSISEGNYCASPPRRLRDFADFVDLVISDYGDTFDELEIWNEPNNSYKWDFSTYDPDWRKFGEMAGTAAYWAQQRGKRTVLGGIIPVDPHWLMLMEEYGALKYMDIVGIHSFPGMWWPFHPNWDWHHNWHGWEHKTMSVKRPCNGKPVWITETGLATWDLRTSSRSKFDLQVKLLQEAAEAPTERIYWYSLVDMDPQKPAIEGLHVDENEYHMGLVTWDGYKKDAFYKMRELLAQSNSYPQLCRDAYGATKTL